jgi:cyclophilin family peptidyl-prolyl cis-trans isomerase
MMKLALICFLGLALAAAMAAPAQAANPVVVIETNLGTIEAELYEDKAPGTVKNFLAYVDDKHYDGLIFHRVISNFMIQGGGFEPGMKQKKTKDPIKNESSNGLSNVKGTLAMARLGRDLGSVKAADSATSQFFINVKDNTNLDKAKAGDGVGYCVFGAVTKGMDIVEKIRDVKTGMKGQFDDVPVEDVVIKSIKKK